MNYKELANQFVQYYYQLFNPEFDEEFNFKTHENRAQLSGLYHQNSLCTYQLTELQGHDNIMTFLMSEHIQKQYKHVINFNAQPAIDDTLIIVVQGETFFPSPEENPNDENSMKLHFMEIFLIGQNPEADGFIVHNQMFSTQGF